MSEPGSERKRRRRRRASAPQGPVPAAPAPAAKPPEPAPQPTDPAAGPRRRRKAAKEHSPGGTDRGMRDLVGSGRSALGVDGALRGRDVNRPTQEDLAEAETEVSIVRRNWRPPPEKR